MSVTLSAAKSLLHNVHLRPADTSPDSYREAEDIRAIRNCIGLGVPRWRLHASGTRVGGGHHIVLYIHHQKIANLYLQVNRPVTLKS